MWWISTPFALPIHIPMTVTASKPDSWWMLFEKVKVIRGGEIITGDYAKINTESESYKIISNNKEKVKVLITNTNE